MILLDQFQRIHALAFDVDGVMTNGELLLTDDGQFLRTFHIRDGYAIRKALDEGIKLIVISGGKSIGVDKRLRDLGMTDIYLGVNNKLPVLKDWLLRNNIKESELVYMGDDILDIECLSYAHVKACPADAVPEVLAVANYISPNKGGHGCVRDIIELILKAKGKW